MKKTLIALAVAGVSFNAAAVNLSGDDVQERAVVKYTSEISFPKQLSANTKTFTVDADGEFTYTTTNAAVDGSESALNITTELGRELPATQATQTLFVRIDLTNAQFAGAVDGVDGGDLDVTAISAIANLTAATSGLATDGFAGGQTSDTFVVVPVTITAAASSGGAVVPATTPITLKLGNVYALNGQDVGVQYSLYTSASEAKDAAATTVSKSGTLIEFTESLQLVANSKNAGSANEFKIDVPQFSKYFFDPQNKDTKEIDSVKLANLSVGADAGVLLAGGDAATLAGIASGGKLEVSGQFGAGLKKADGTLDFTNLLTLGAVAVDTANSTESLVAFNVTTDTTEDLVFTVDGETELFAQDLSVVFKPAAKQGYVLANKSLDLGQLQRNSKTLTVELGLNPNSSFAQFIRVVNESGVEGKIDFVVKDDNGEVGYVTLADLEGFDAKLGTDTAARSIKVKDLFEAARNDNSELSDKGMLRIQVIGETGAPLKVQSYVVGANGSAFGVTSNESVN